MSHSGFDEEGSRHLTWFSGEGQGTGQSPETKGMENPRILSAYHHGPVTKPGFQAVWPPVIGKAGIR